jgi:hypothetical protein
VPSGIVGVVFDDFTMLNDVPYFLAADHPFRPSHLLNSVRQEQESAAAQSPQLLLNFAALHHTLIVQPANDSARNNQ